DEASDKKVVNMRGTGKATIQPKQNPIEKFFAVWKKSDVKKLTKKAPTEYKKMVNMLVSLSAVLFVITFIMGAGVIQADNNITRLENDLHALNNAFIYVQGRVNQLAGQVHAQSISEQQNAAVPVFAPDDVPLAQLQEQTNQTAQQTNNQQDATLQNVLVLPNEHVQGSNNQQNQNVTTPPATHPPAYNQNLPQATPRVRLGMSFEEALALSIIINEFDSYIIQRGDTLSGIVHRFYGSADLIEVVMEVNNILHPDLIMFGSELLLPRLYAHNLPEE
ncbi:MAG: LysM peptidoglycan-binding domain-containing protein, partial [Defluviitaleaceae bacterium]|nr:LysM peptidoglycan-binding domain-containing protein [Defluviitaleaceae bacterium]